MSATWLGKSVVFVASRPNFARRSASFQKRQCTGLGGAYPGATAATIADTCAQRVVQRSAARKQMNNKATKDTKTNRYERFCDREFEVEDAGCQHEH